MTSILDQFDDGNMETIPEEIIEDKIVTKKKKKLPVNKGDDLEVEERREQLCILSVLGTIDQYTGIRMSLGDVKRLSIIDVNKYYNRYQLIMGNMVTNSLVNGCIEGFVEAIAYAVPIYNKNELCNDLKKMKCYDRS